MKHISLMVGALAFSMAAQVEAAPEDAGFYIGIGGGSSDIKAERNDVLGTSLAALRPAQVFPATSLPAIVPLDQIPAGASASPFLNRLFDHSDAALSVTAGYAFNRYLSAEISYADLGELTSQVVANVRSMDTDTITNSLQIDQKVKFKTVSLSPLGTLPVTRWFKLFARGGYVFSTAETDVTTSLIQNVISTSFNPRPEAQPRVTARSRSSDDFDSNALVLGAGASFDVFKGLTLRAEFNSFMDVGDDAFTADVDVDTAGLTVLYRF